METLSNITGNLLARYLNENGYYPGTSMGWHSYSLDIKTCNRKINITVGDDGVISGKSDLRPVSFFVHRPAESLMDLIDCHDPKAFEKVLRFVNTIIEWEKNE